MSGNFNIVCFIDDNSFLWGRSIYGIKIYPLSEIKSFKAEINQILLAIPSLPKEKRKEIYKRIQKFDIEVLQVPSIDDLTSGRAYISDLIPIEISDILGREVAPVNPDLIGPGIYKSVVCITGAGGSIGSELCRQIYHIEAKEIILLERNEHSLYKIYQELSEYKNKKVKLSPVLGSTGDLKLLESLFLNKNVDIVFHAAAYKHVPLVESNPMQGIENNIFSTLNICKASISGRVKKMTLISTDKAVRPHNIMGATKRVSELILQYFASKQNKTCFSMVRFGNVLGSSGSVVPLFKKQISRGGPITLTHPEVVRFFMTISEAVQLVIQSSVLAKGGEVFLLDMGEPIKIKELAKQMIELSGLKVKDINNPSGDIEIITSGLRPGEKLHEELLVDSYCESTSHELIFKAKETTGQNELLINKLKDLEKYILKKDKINALILLKEIVPEWKNSRKFS